MTDDVGNSYIVIGAAILIVSLILVTYYSWISVVTPQKRLKITLLFYLTLFLVIMASPVTGATLDMTMQFHTLPSNPLMRAIVPGLGMLVIGLLDMLIPMLINLFYFRKETLTPFNIEERQNFYTTNSSWYMVRVGGGFTGVAVVFLAFGVLPFIQKRLTAGTKWVGIPLLFIALFGSLILGAVVAGHIQIVIISMILKRPVRFNKEQPKHGSKKRPDFEFLPLGSVVSIAGFQSRLVIIQRLVVTKTDEYYDYGAVVYPDGLVNMKLVYFSHNVIKQVIFHGYTNAEERQLAKNFAETIAVMTESEGDGGGSRSA